MVFLWAGVVVGTFGVVMMAFPEQVLRYQRWRHPEGVIETTPERLTYVRYGGAAFLAIGGIFAAGAQLGVL